eukprot:TRINITY_DN17230_c0_g1_i1.p1 TRINITY_DN17230_c0_g1~~TRINITY_DN17230_c0_g1_i1.p1  ORF type:complete len:253 (-),score=38.27 TRINITY_DN17230_c0_g1_i1:81-839(-)
MVPWVIAPLAQRHWTLLRCCCLPVFFSVAIATSVSADGNNFLEEVVDAEGATFLLQTDLRVVSVDRRQHGDGASVAQRSVTARSYPVAEVNTAAAGAPQAAAVAAEVRRGTIVSPTSAPGVAGSWHDRLALVDAHVHGIDLSLAEVASTLASALGFGQEVAAKERTQARSSAAVAQPLSAEPAGRGSWVIYEVLIIVVIIVVSCTCCFQFRHAGAQRSAFASAPPVASNANGVPRAQPVEKRPPAKKSGMCC